jgi:hypothetical protein
MNKSRSILSEEQISALEASLAGTLQRVTPPLEVVTRLRERIHFPEPRLIALRLRDWQRMFLVFGGVMSGMLVLITIARALFYLVRRHV